MFPPNLATKSEESYEVAKGCITDGSEAQSEFFPRPHGPNKAEHFLACLLPVRTSPVECSVERC